MTVDIACASFDLDSILDRAIYLGNQRETIRLVERTTEIRVGTQPSWPLLSRESLRPSSSSKIHRLVSNYGAERVSRNRILLFLKYVVYQNRLANHR